MQLKLYSAIIKDCTFVGIVVGISLASGNLQIGHTTITNTVITEYQKLEPMLTVLVQH
jgi:hypothetical protein